MKIHTLVKSKGLKSKATRKGRGNGSKGNYSGKGLKWQKARSGWSIKPYFEGGQTSIVQRVPKARWFTRYFKLISSRSVVNLSDLEADKRIDKKATLTRDVLKDLWYIGKEEVVKILWSGEIKKSLTFDWKFAFSASAQEKILAAGGSVPQNDDAPSRQDNE